MTGAVTRYLGALRLVDATSRLPVERPLRVRSETLTLFRNRSGLYVIRDAPGFQDYTVAFEAPPANTPPHNATVEISDPLGQYLRRIATFTLPWPKERPADQAGPALFTPHTLQLLPSPAAPARSGWAVVRAQVQDTVGVRLPGALLRLTAGSTVEVWGMTDDQGEAQLRVPDIPRVTWGASADTAVLAQGLTVSVQAGAHPALYDAERTLQAVPDPDALQGVWTHLRRSSVASFSLSSGQHYPIRIPMQIDLS
ncbi:MAG: hypothetical protein H6739_35405 [Alphaproteobacteria bacterium]|nr:hypothetical protein [Alphaproteobacteria bacterium]